MRWLWALWVVTSACSAAGTPAAPGRQARPADVAPLRPQVVSESGEVASARAETEPPGAEGGVPAQPRAISALIGLEKIREAPRWTADVIGVFRAGQSIPLADDEPLAREQGDVCEGGWYAVRPRGFVCASASTAFRRDHPQVLAAALVLPATERAYPYHYGRALGSPRYRRLPSVDEQLRREPWLAAADLGSAVDDELSSLPGDLRRHFEARQQAADDEPLTDPLPAYPTMKLAWAYRFDARGRSWLVTPDLALVPADRVRIAAEVEPRGFDLGAADPRLPFALTLEQTPKLSRRDLAWHQDGQWPARALVPLNEGTPTWLGGRTLVKSAEGPWLDARTASLFAPRPRPAGVGAHDKWVSVKIGAGALVAYEGDRPLYAAAISPGAHGANPGGKHRTPPGRYRISAKWLTSDMGGRLGQGSWRTREVPWVAYYDGSYALHGAWWHDQFGRPRSHGCINLTPADSRWLFSWLDPPLPEGWYAVRADHDAASTVVVVSP